MNDLFMANHVNYSITFYYLIMKSYNYIIRINKSKCKNIMFSGANSFNSNGIRPNF